jgi:hypothetical protein
MNFQNIPFVYMWVNGDDNIYKEKYNIVNSTSRNRNNNELYYSIKSICKFMPSSWKGKIYIVTDNQIPDFLEKNNNYYEYKDRLRLKYEIREIYIIDHKDIIPNEFLPTRNSSIIEFFLHNINGIEDEFITINDDFFICKNVEYNDFLFPFNENKIQLNKYNEFKSLNMTWRCSIINTINLIQNKLKLLDPSYHSYPLYLQHSPMIFSKLLILKMFEIFKDEINNNKEYRLERSYNQINPKFLIIYYMLYNKDKDFKDIKDSKSKSKSKSESKYLKPVNSEFYCEINDNIDFKLVTKKLLNLPENIKFICFNDNFKLKSTSEKFREMLKYFELFVL